jgi:serine/threonine protein kinase/tetratricopeptide (TPR) repeat protein
MNTIGRYQLVEKLGQGGMGVVYRAFDPLLQRVVAVKLIAAVETNDELRERFFREARAAGQLSHKNIITIHDLGEHEGQPFLAMEFLEGQDLQQRMASKVPMSLARKLELAIELGEAVEYAHAHNVIHRDIKPANIFITTSGTAKILDFGLARIITSELTNSNMMMGTLNYMAPEQVRGERADHRSDIFSTGVVLYELLGGKKAFEGDSFGATLYKILQEIPEPLPNIDPHVPPELVAIVEHSLEKAREDRYQTMSEMLRDLVAYRQQWLLMNSPTFGQPVSGSEDVTMPARPATPLPSGRPGSGGLTARPGSGTPYPRPGSGSSARPGSTPLPGPADVTQPAQISPVAAVPQPQRRNPVVAAALIAGVVILGGALAWVVTRKPPAPQKVEAPAAPTTVDPKQQDIANRLEQASKALQAGDDAEAQKQADAVLAISPGHPEALKLRDRAQQAATTVSRSLNLARQHFSAGRFDEASRAAGEVLAVDPDNAEARRLMDDAAARSRGRGAEEARSRMLRARGAAAAAGAPNLAAAPYAAAVAAERDATGLYKQGRLGEAMSKFWEASGLFRSAEIAAQTEAAARAERTRVAQAERKPAQEPAPQTPTVPLSPTTSGGLPLPSSPPITVAPPPPPPPASPPAATQPSPPHDATPPAAPPTAGITDVLERYKAALENRNLDGLKRIWPGLGGAQESAIRSDFQNANRISVDIQSPQINVSGTNAMVVFVRRYQVQMNDGQRVQSQSRTTMNLHRSGTTWVIDQMRFEPIK